MAKDRLHIDFSDLGLNLKEIRFVSHYCANGFNAIEAMKEAKLLPDAASGAVARIRSLEILNRPSIKEAINRFIANEIAPLQDKFRYQVLTTWQARAFYDVRTFYNSDGSVKPLDQIPVEMRSAIERIVEDFKGKDADRRVVNYQLADKAQAYKVLAEVMANSGGEVEDIPNEMRSKLQEIFKKVGAAGVNAGMEMAKAIAPPKEEKKVTPQQLIREIREGVPLSRRDIRKKKRVDAYIEENNADE